MNRFFSLLSLLMVFATGSTFTLVCALACGGPPVSQATEAASPCHGHTPDPAEEIPGPGFHNISQACPVLAAMEKGERYYAPAPFSFKKGPELGLKLLRLESDALALAEPDSFSLISEFSPPDPTVPLYLKKRVLRI